MRLAKTNNIFQLGKYGFVKITKKLINERCLEGSDIACMEGWLYDMGGSRRGQFYYLVCSLDGEFSIVATTPDGSGGALELEKDSIFSKLIRDKIAR
jgi:hypothetical protein